MKFLFPVLFFLIFNVGCDSEPPIIEPRPGKPIPVGEFLDEWTYKVNPRGGFGIATFKLTLPDSTDPADIKAIVVLLSGYNTNGLGLAGSNNWEIYARERKVALLSVHLKDEAGSNYTDAREGSGQALITALDSLAAKHQIDHLASLPFLLRGFSAGGNFSYSFSAWNPERVIAFANIRGGMYQRSVTGNESIPGLVLAGEFEEDSRKNTLRGIVETNRAGNGLWCFAEEPNVGHFGEMARADNLIKLFFSKALAARVEPGIATLQPISPASGWLGTHDTHAVFPYDSFPDDKAKASWLIDQSFAKAWEAHQDK